MTPDRPSAEPAEAAHFIRPTYASSNAPLLHTQGILRTGPSRSVDWTAIEGTIRRRFRDDLPGVIRASFQIWVPVNCLHFGLLRPQFRVLSLACVSTGWNGYLSLVNHKHVGDGAQALPECVAP